MIVAVMAGVIIGVLAMSSRSGIGRRDAYWRVASVVVRVGIDVHTVRDIDPDEPANMSVLVAFE